MSAGSPSSDHLTVDPTPAAAPPHRGWQPMEMGRYRVTIAETLAEREAACRLRFKVFNIELGEGLQTSYKTGLDTDHFDLFCDQLIVEDRNSRSIVGTYRMQTGSTAAQNMGYYSEAGVRFHSLRAPSTVGSGTGKGLNRPRTPLQRSADVAVARDCPVHPGPRPALPDRVFLGELAGLQGWLGDVSSAFRISGWRPVSHRLDRCLHPPSTGEAPEIMAKVPKLLRTYIGIGAKICGPPALDREFGTIDFLTLLDMRELTPAARVRFLIEAQ